MQRATATHDLVHGLGTVGKNGRHRLAIRDRQWCYDRIRRRAIVQRNWQRDITRGLMDHAAIQNGRGGSLLAEGLRVMCYLSVWH